MCGNHVRRAVRTLTCVRQKTVLTRSHISKGDMQKAKPLNLCHVVRAETMYFIQKYKLAAYSPVALCVTQ